MITTLIAAMTLLQPMGADSFFDLTATDIDGKEVKMDAYKGKVLLIVNVASRCGLTPQYKSLQALYDSRKEKGFEILAFPANDFGKQEPGTNEEIKQFCEANYGIKFRLFSKTSVKGDEMHPVYKWLLANGPSKDDIEWNFAKFVIGRDGKVADRFSPKLKPDDPELLKSIDTALAVTP